MQLVNNPFLTPHKLDKWKRVEKERTEFLDFSVPPLVIEEQLHHDFSFKDSMKGGVGRLPYLRTLSRFSCVAV